MSRNCELKPYQWDMCRIFSTASAGTAQAHEFCNRATSERPTEEIVRDTMIGKLAEVAVCNLIHECGYWDASVNYEVMPKNIGDGCDLTVNGWTIDVKSTRCGRVLMYEKKRAEYRERTNTLPDFLVLCKTSWDMDTDKPDGNGVSIIGGFNTRALMSADRLLQAGEVIPGTRSSLQAANYFASASELHNFESMVSWMIKHPKYEWMLNHRKTA